MSRVQIVEGIPRNILPSIFAQTKQQQSTPEPSPSAVHSSTGAGIAVNTPTISQAPAPNKTATPDAIKVARLIQLLPPAYHTTILLECYREPHPTNPSTLAISIPDMCPTPGANTPPVSVVFELLAAAAPLAGGSLEAAWTMATAMSHVPGGGSERYAAVQQANHPACGLLAAASDHLPAGTSGAEAAQEAESRKRDSQGAAQRAVPAQEATSGDRRSQAMAPDSLPEAAGSLAKLKVALHQPAPLPAHSGQVIEHPRWCAALTQLRTVRTLSLSAFGPAGFSPKALAPALLSLRAIHTLSLRCQESTFLEYEYLETVQAAEELMRAVCALTQLSALELHHCFVVGEREYDEHLPARDRRGPVGMPGVSRLSRLSRLTSLALTATGYEGQGSEHVLRAVQRLTGLRHLQATLRTEAYDVGIPEEHGYEHACYTACRLFDVPKHPVLQSISQPRLYRPPPDSFGGHLYVDVGVCFWPWSYNQELAGRLTALDLSGNGESVGMVPVRPQPTKPLTFLAE